MIRYREKGVSAEQTASDSAKVRVLVESVLADINPRGDAAVREYSTTFDKWSPKTFRLSRAGIDAGYRELPSRAIEDIRFAQQQVRSFAQIQRAALTDVEVETLPDVVLGHRNTAINSVGCHVPGGTCPPVASAHMSVVTAKVAGVKRGIAPANLPTNSEQLAMATMADDISSEHVQVMTRDPDCFSCA